MTQMPSDFPQPKKSNTKMIVIIVLACVGVLGLLMVAVCAGVLLPSVGQAREMARATKSMVQLRQIGIAFSQYAADNQNKLPETARGWEQRLAPKYISMEVLHSPNAQHGEVSYIYIPGVNLFALTPQPLAYENPELGLKLHPVVYTDGHVELLRQAEFEQMLKQWNPGKAAR